MLGRRFGLVVAGAALLVAAGCGSDRPSVQDMAESLKSGDAGRSFGIDDGLLNDTQYECIAKAIVDSKLSDASVEALLRADKAYKISQEESRKMSAVGEVIKGCRGS